MEGKSCKVRFSGHKGPRSGEWRTQKIPATCQAYSPLRQWFCAFCSRCLLCLRRNQEVLRQSSRNNSAGANSAFEVTLGDQLIVGRGHSITGKLQLLSQESR